MLLFFALRSAAAARDEHQLGNGETLPYRAEHRRQYFSIFGKKEAVVTGLYTIAPHPRTRAGVVASLFHPAHPPVATTPQRLGPQHKRLWATMAGKDAALERLVRQVASREGAHILHRVALTDGAEALPDRVRLYFPTFTLVLDFIHADEKLWNAIHACTMSRARHKTGSKTKSWLILTCCPSCCPAQRAFIIPIVVPQHSRQQQKPAA